MKSWIDQEPGWQEARRDLRAAWRRSRSRWKLTLGLTLLLVAAVVGWRARRQRTFDASIVIRVTEHSFDEKTAPPPAGKLTEYLFDVALSRPTLLAVVKEHELYPELFSVDETWAVDEMREDIELEVVQNYFAPEHFIQNPVRTARVVLTYTGRDPELTLLVVRELGDLIANEQHESRKLTTRLTAATAHEAVRELKGQISRARVEQIRYSLVQEKTPLQIVRLRRTIDEIKSLEHQLEIMTITDQGLALRSELEGAAEGLRFEVVDRGREPTIFLTRMQALILRAIFTFLVSLPPVAIGIGILDFTVRDDENLRRLGIKFFGRVPAFEGDRVGTLAGRSKSA